MSLILGGLFCQVVVRTGLTTTKGGTFKATKKSPHHTGRTSAWCCGRIASAASVDSGRTVHRAIRCCGFVDSSETKLHSTWLVILPDSPSTSNHVNLLLVCIHVVRPRSYQSKSQSKNAWESQSWSLRLSEESSQLCRCKSTTKIVFIYFVGLTIDSNKLL